MNYNEFYKQANDKVPAWKQTIDGVKGYQDQLPMLALLAGTGALGGYALSNKKKRGAGALYGGISLPSLYLAYLYGRRNGYLGKLDNKGNAFDDWTNAWVNGPVNSLFEAKPAASTDDKKA